MATKHWLGGAGIVGASAYALQNGIPEIAWNIVSTWAGVVSGAAEMTAEAVSTLLQSAWINEVIAGAALPSVATMLAANYTANKITDLLKIDGNTKKYLKWAASAAGFAAWVVGDSVAMPYILAAAGLIAVKDIPLWALGKAGQWVGAAWWATSSFVWWGVKWAAKWTLNWVKEWWKSPSIKPRPGF